MELKKDQHYFYLEKSYSLVGRETWKNKDFLLDNLLSSRKLFTDKSLKIRSPRPKNLEVYALLSGLPFDGAFTNSLISVQSKISEILKDSLHYWVKPVNFGVEHCVFKWPDQKWDNSWNSIINQNLLSLNRGQSFKYYVYGIQINPDGCVVAKGYDEGEVIFKNRDRLKSNLNFLPDRQSGWAHIPLGRILEPVGSLKFIELKNLIDRISESMIASTQLHSIKFVHEKRWYMEERTIISEHNL